MSGGIRIGSARRAAVLAVVAVLGLAGCTSGPDRDPETGELLEPADLPVFELRVGDCIADFNAAGEVTTVRAVPCADEHTDEIFAAVEIPDDDEYPGHEAITEFGDNECYERFEQFVGVPWEESELSYGYLGPTETSWADGDRELLCTVGDPRGAVTGTLEDADR